MKLTREFFLRLSIGLAGLRDMVLSDGMRVEGSRTDLLSFFSPLDQPDGQFAIATP